MGWNIQFQFAALLLALVVASMCLGQKRLHFAAERAFVRLLILVIVSILMDILSIFAIEYRDFIGIELCNLACKVYLVTLAAVGCQAAWFAVAEIRYTFPKFWVYMTAAPVFAEIAAVAFFPIYIHDSDSSVYTYGIPVTVTYLLCALYILATLLMVIILRKYINNKRRVAIYFWMICWATVATIQFINSELLMVSFALALACMYMYCKLENPEYHLDFTTTAFNKRGFAMIMSEHLKAHEDKALVTVSIGDMNMVNEVFGNNVAERMIVRISEFADGIPNTSLFRLEDTLFCILADSADEADKAIEQVIRRFDEPWVVDGVEIEVSAYISYLESISRFKEADTLQELIRYFAQESKKLSQGEVLFINESELSQRQLSIEHQHILEWALKNDGVEVFFQPIYNIKAGKFSVLEALVRIRDEEGNLIMPDDFIEIAEKNGMILKLGETIFRKTCEFMQRMHVEDYGIEYVEVNLSVVQVMQEDLARTLKNIMGEYQIAPYRINFEITETAAVNSRKTMERNMKALIDYGCGFSLDDYGSGYSNISYIVSMQLKIVKIDKQMASSYFTSEKVKIATDYTIEMLHKLGMSIVVEGVETEEQYKAFKELGVEYIQGFYFSRPLPREQLIPFVQKWL